MSKQLCESCDNTINILMADYWFRREVWNGTSYVVTYQCPHCADKECIEDDK